MHTYSNEFEEARQRTARLGLNCPKIHASEKRLITDLNGLANVAARNIGQRTPQEIVGQCFSIHADLIPALEQFFNSPVYFTIGWIEDPPEKFHELAEERIESLLHTASQKPTFNLHAWLTLPSMEIMDFVFPTTLAVVRGKPDQFGSAICKHPSDFTGGLQFHPMLIGVDFLLRIGALTMR
jgi:hypothetical protein